MNWIWVDDSKERDVFAEFELPFFFDGECAELFISADYKYAAFIDNTRVSSGQYADLPDYKSVNREDITSFLRRGENVLRVIAWHMGMDFSVCRTMPASVAFEIKVDGVTVAESDKNTRCRKAYGYKKGDMITPQLGMGFAYDFTSCADSWGRAVEIKTGFREIARPIKQTVIGDVCVSNVISQGVFKYRYGGDAAKMMQNAYMVPLPLSLMAGSDVSPELHEKAPLSFSYEDGDGVFIIADMGRETSGHLGFTVTVPKECKMLLGWGEHLTGGRVRTKIGPRSFAMEIELRAGENVLDDYLLRLGCRYICIFAQSSEITVTRLGIREVTYPFSVIKKDFGSSLLNKIYECGRRTLILSAHEHYEDCPWREQALYGMDSRNQMLFGYGAFGEYEYPRANLMLIARSIMECGLIPLTAPAEKEITIPSFTAYWLIAIGENAEADYNEEFLRDIIPYAERGICALLKRETERGLSIITEPYGWNFQEWSEGLDGGEIFRDSDIEPCDDAILTALVTIALRKLIPVYERLGLEKRAAELLEAHARLTLAIGNFYDKSRRVYASYIKDGVKCGYHEFTQAVILCSGAVPAELEEELCHALMSPGAYSLIPLTLASLQFKYEALLRYASAVEFSISDIERIFGNMLSRGATSYYETEMGEADFDGAGSLCHGWSAVPCWLLDTVEANKKKQD